MIVTPVQTTEYLLHPYLAATEGQENSHLSGRIHSVLCLSWSVNVGTQGTRRLEADLSPGPSVEILSRGNFEILFQICRHPWSANTPTLHRRPEIILYPTAARLIGLITVGGSLRSWRKSMAGTTML